MYTAIMVVYADNHTRYTYDLYNPDIKWVIITRDIKWVELKMTNPAKTMKMFCNTHKEYLVRGREEDQIHTSDPENKLHGNVILD